MKIYHIADIHIKDSRREEYKMAIDKISNDMSHDNDDTKIAVLAGDIFDAKTKLTSVNIIDFFYMIDKFSRLCKYVITMPGNHDMNLNNSNSIDLIEPLVVRYDNVYHFSDTGSYTFNDIDACFNVISPADSVTQYPYSYKSKYNFLIVHENINSVMHNGVKLNGRVLSDEFGKYNAVFVGHIHECTFMGKNAAYSGSMIQQTIGESYIKGYVVWIPSPSKEDKAWFTPSFVPIPNMIGFIKMIVNADGSKLYNTHPYFKDQFDTLCRPSNPTRISIENYTQDDVETLKHDLPIHDSTEVTVSQKTECIKQKEINLNNSEQHLVNHMDNINIPTSIQSDILKLHNEYSTTSHFKTQKTQWYINKLVWSNMFCYGENNIIEFNPGTLGGIIADNRNGKSSVIDILAYSLFNELLRGDVKNIINVRFDTANVSVYFTLNNSYHEIHRNFKRKRNGINQTISYIIDGKNCTDITPDLTYRKIGETIGTFDNFVTISVLTQDKVNDFLSMPNQNKFDFLKNILDLNALEKQLEDVKQKHRVLQLDRAKYSVKKMDDIKHEIEETKHKYEHTLDEKNKTQQVIDNTKNACPMVPKIALHDIQYEISKIKQSLGEINTNNIRDMYTIQSEYDTISKYIYNNDIKKLSSEDTTIDRHITKQTIDKPLDILYDNLKSIKLDIQKYPKYIIENNIRKYEYVKNLNKPVETLEELESKITEIKTNLTRNKYVSYLDRFVKYCVENGESKLRNDIDIMYRIRNILRTNKVVPIRHDKDELIKLIDESKKNKIELLTLQELYNSSYEKYHDAVLTHTKNDIIQDISTHESINAVKIVNNLRSSNVIKRELEKHRSSSSLSKQMLALNPEFLNFVNNMEYGNECECCSKNKILLSKIMGLENNNISIQFLIRELETVSILTKELKLSEENECNIKLIDKLNSSIKVRQYDYNTLKYIVDKYDTIMNNMEYYKKIQFISQSASKLKEYEDELVSIEVVELQLKLNYKNETPEHLEMILKEYNNIHNNSIEKSNMNKHNDQLTSLTQKTDWYKYYDSYSKLKLHDTYSEIVSNIIYLYNKAQKDLLTVSKELNIRKMLDRLQILDTEFEIASEQKKLYDEECLKMKLYKDSIQILSSYEFELKTIENKLKELDNECCKSTKALELDTKLSIYSEYIRCLDNKTGFPILLLNEACGSIERVANEFLLSLKCGFGIKIIVEQKPKTSILKVKMVYEEFGKQYEISHDMASGYQKIIISLALRHAFGMVTKLPTLDMMIVDEGLAALDNKNLDLIIEYIPSLKSIYKKLIIISHIETIKLIIDDPIFIKREQGLSFIRQDTNKNIYI